MNLDFKKVFQVLGKIQLVPAYLVSNILIARKNFKKVYSSLALFYSFPLPINTFFVG